MRAGERGFVALYAILTLAALLGVAALVIVHWQGGIDRDRARGGKALAERVALDFIHRRLAEERQQVPRPWVSATRGEARLEDGSEVHWERIPLESRWRAGARPWVPEWDGRLIRLGASDEAVLRWKSWMNARMAQRDSALGVRGDLVQDRAFLAAIFADLGLQARWGGPERIWTADEGGSLGRLNVLGADPEMLEALTGVPALRIREVQSLAAPGVPDAAAAAGFWRFEEQQALEPVATLRPFSECRWRVDVRIPNLRGSINTQWRVSLEDGTPGNPWFRIRPISSEVW